MKKVLINGAGGFIGGILVRKFLSAGYKVRASDMDHVDLQWAKDMGAEIAYCSLEDSEAIDRSVAGVDVIVHTAAIFNLAIPEETIMRVNVNGTRNYCESALRHNVQRIILFSTSGIYGIPDKPFIDETAKIQPRNAYEKSKWECEKLAVELFRSSQLPVSIVRPTLVYGPGSKYGQAMYVALGSACRIWGLENLILPSEGRVSHSVHVDDVCSAVQVLVESGDKVNGQAYNIADLDPVSSDDFIEILCQQLGINIRYKSPMLSKITIPLTRRGQGVIKYLLDRVNFNLTETWNLAVEKQGISSALAPVFDIGWLDYLWADHSYSTSKLAALGWEPKYPSIREGIVETIQWYRKERWIPGREELVEMAVARKLEA